MMPLGATDKIIFTQKRIDLNPGDTLLLLSDGLPELFNDKREMFDFIRVKEILLKNSEKTSADIISELKDEADKWRNGLEQNDDITFVVVKCKETK
jgi:sigma-B regulation protein RsbU (phosphoserine phosphatase)